MLSRPAPAIPFLLGPSLHSQSSHPCGTVRPPLLVIGRSETGASEPDHDDEGKTMTSNITAVQADRDSGVRAVFAEVSRAWADGDAAAFVEWYADDATAVLPGFYLRDRNAIRASMAVAFAGPLRGSRRIHKIDSLRYVGDTTAVVVSNSVTVFPSDAEPAAERREWATWLLARHGDRWLIEAYHGCPESASPGTNGDV